MHLEKVVGVRGLMWRRRDGVQRAACFVRERARAKCRLLHGVRLQASCEEMSVSASRGNDKFDHHLIRPRSRHFLALLG